MKDSTLAPSFRPPSARPVLRRDPGDPDAARRQHTDATTFASRSTTPPGTHHTVVTRGSTRPYAPVDSSELACPGHVCTPAPMLLQYQQLQFQLLGGSKKALATLCPRCDTDRSHLH
eukprot:5940350-Pyramimonas_sp.AAC.1